MDRTSVRLLIGAAVAAATSDGYFPKGRSILRRVQEERAVGLLFGQRALMLGAMMHPLAFYGTNAHTAAKMKPFQRLVHTAKVFETVFFGSREEADAALAFVRRLHERVNGTLPHDLGPWPAGTPYSALDPEEMLWGVSATVFDSAQVIYETLVRGLSDDEREAMWREYVRFGELFGMPREVAPATYGEFRAAWDARIVSDEVFLSEEAREAGHATGFEIPVPRQNRPAMRALEFLLTGTLPARARELYGLRWGRAQQAAFDAMALASRHSRPLTPGPIRRGSCHYFFDLVATTERRRIERGEATPQLVSSH
jgi:uncharacterized protein (DUF2236 family)